MLKTNQTSGVCQQEKKKTLLITHSSLSTKLHAAQLNLFLYLNIRNFLWACISLNWISNRLNAFFSSTIPQIASAHLRQWDIQTHQPSLYIQISQISSLHLYSAIFSFCLSFPSYPFALKKKSVISSPSWSPLYVLFLSRSAPAVALFPRIPCRLIQHCESPLVSQRGSRWPWSWSVSLQPPLCGPPGPSVFAIAVGPTFLSPVDKSTVVRWIRFKFTDIFLLVHLDGH